MHEKLWQVQEWTLGQTERKQWGGCELCVWEGEGEAVVAAGSRMPKKVGFEAGEVKSRCSRGSSTSFWCVGWGTLQHFEQENNKAILGGYFFL